MKTTGKLFFTVILLIFLSSCSSDDENINDIGNGENPENPDNPDNPESQETEAFVQVQLKGRFKGNLIVSAGIFNRESNSLIEEFDDEYIDSIYTVKNNIIKKNGEFVHLSILSSPDLMPGYNEPARVKILTKINDNIQTEQDTLITTTYFYDEFLHPED